MATLLIRRLALLVLAAAVAAALAPSAATADHRRIERKVRSQAPDAKIVRQTLVRIHDPLPADAGPHPRACDWLSYLRFRNPRAPRHPGRAHAVLAIMPGFLGGAASFDQVARHIVRRAALRRRNVEVWALDRRANCLEDHHGVRAGARARDPRVSFGYYFYGREVEGRRFGGFVSREDAAFLGEFGLERTVRDWHTVVTRELPWQRTRQRKLICGGHSLGGPLTAAFVAWDFDGDPGTTDDAGYNQCAALAGLDTTVDLDGESGGAAGVGAASDLLGEAGGGSPYIDAPPLTPRTLQTVPLIGVAAHQQPRQESIINSELVPDDPEFELTLRLLFARNARDFATGDPSPRDFRLTNETALAAIFDDNSAGISIFRSSLGFFTGGPLVDKRFPAHDPTLAAPEEPRGPLYRWVRYRRVGAPGVELEPNDAGDPYTGRDSEVTAMSQFSRALFEAPANFIEQYFPTRVLTDVAAAEGGDRSGSLRHLRHDGASKLPILLVQAGDSDSNSGDDSGPARTGAKPNDKRLSREAILPGYNHLDVATAAWRQSDGRPEPASRELLRYMLRVARQAARR